MLDRDHAAVAKSLLALSLLLLSAGPVLAYGGPGAGVEFIGYFMSLLVWLGLCFSAVFLWPIYALMRRIRGRKNPIARDIPVTQNDIQSVEPKSVEQ